MAGTEVTNEVIIAAQGGDRDAMWQVVSAYEGLLVSTVHAVAPRATPDQFDDLLQEARATLIQHVHAFKTEGTSAQLSTFAHRAVRAEVAREWIRMTSGVTVEVEAARLVRHALAQTEGDIEGAWMIVGSSLDPRRRMSRETFMALLEALDETVSLDSTPGDSSGKSNAYEAGSLADIIPDPSTDFTDPAERRELARFLLASISNRQSFALRAFYGIGMMALADQETALDMQVTTAAVRSTRRAGLDSCRRVATANGLAVAA
ncbi:helix-turn-helix domain-containing protein [Streptomyces roseolus]|uniref:helix-turn-helix domain-containing protein n=1 Tax=Streptomyces roseolus TaxID=67358 RepID=UPI003646761B